VLKSTVGVGELRETPLSHSFCRHVVDTGAPLEVVDARSHPRVHDNPAIQDFGIIAYLGMPLVTRDGIRLGALCAIDHTPREWTGRDHGVLEDLAAAMMAEIELRRANRQVAAAAAELHFAATHDWLTRVGNRRALMTDLAGVIEEGRPATFAVIDVEGMRAYNEMHGHEAGDELLARVAARLENALMHVYRLGGAKFCAILGEPDALTPVLERLDVVCRAVTVELPAEAGDVDAALRLADARL
jgi:diguanylate cyclase (GGDEF)-like protein